MKKKSDRYIRMFRDEVSQKRTRLRRFLTKLSKNTPRNIDKVVSAIEPSVWSEVDCLSCANCCKEMSPTYSAADIRRIAWHEHMTPAAFKKKWLRRDREGDWLNKSTPCQFLDLDTNKCRIYAIRPADCAGFPHLGKRRLKDYVHVHKQNVEFCPATLRMVEKIMASVNTG